LRNNSQREQIMALTPASLSLTPMCFHTTCLQAERIFALTGCTAVCLVCYCIPVYIHLRLHAWLAQQAAQHKAACSALASRASDSCRNAGLRQRACMAASQWECGQEQPDPAHGSCEGCAEGHDECSGPLLLVSLPGVTPAPGAQLGLHASTTVRTAAGTHPNPLRQPLLEPQLQEEGCGGEMGDAAGLPPFEHAAHIPARAVYELYVLPAVVVTVGVGCSVAGLYVGIRDVWQSWQGAAAGNT
jgi:hypothetical protein